MIRATCCLRGVPPAPPFPVTAIPTITSVDLQLRVAVYRERTAKATATSMAARPIPLSHLVGANVQPLPAAQDMKPNITGVVPAPFGEIVSTKLKALF